ncbi:MAG: hypothetical protein M1829_000894 [Trizodia sp. TS-e1964]|nr:MAG: hypothetical protein M1829_000894 [Trizodia sp. TS-e1964]
MSSGNLDQGLAAPESENTRGRRGRKNPNSQATKVFQKEPYKSSRGRGSWPRGGQQQQRGTTQNRGKQYRGSQAGGWNDGRNQSSRSRGGRPRGGNPNNAGPWGQNLPGDLSQRTDSESKESQEGESKDERTRYVNGRAEKCNDGVSQILESPSGFYKAYNSGGHQQGGVNKPYNSSKQGGGKQQSADPPFEARRETAAPKTPLSIQSMWAPGPTQEEAAVPKKKEPTPHPSKGARSPAGKRQQGFRPAPGLQQEAEAPKEQGMMDSQWATRSTQGEVEAPKKPGINNSMWAPRLTQEEAAAPKKTEPTPYPSKGTGSPAGDRQQKFRPAPASQRELESPKKPGIMDSMWATRPTQREVEGQKKPAIVEEWVGENFGAELQTPQWLSPDGNSQVSGFPTKVGLRAMPFHKVPLGETSADQPTRPQAESAAGRRQGFPAALKVGAQQQKPYKSPLENQKFYPVGNNGMEVERGLWQEPSQNPDSKRAKAKAKTKIAIPSNSRQEEKLQEAALKKLSESERSTKPTEEQSMAPSSKLPARPQERAPPVSESQQEASFVIPGAFPEESIGAAISRGVEQDEVSVQDTDEMDWEKSEVGDDARQPWLVGKTAAIIGGLKSMLGGKSIGKSDGLSLAHNKFSQMRLNAEAKPFVSQGSQKKLKKDKGYPRVKALLPIITEENEREMANLSKRDELLAAEDESWEKLCKKLGGLSDSRHAKTAALPKEANKIAENFRNKQPQENGQKSAESSLPIKGIDDQAPGSSAENDLAKDAGSSGENLGEASHSLDSVGPANSSDKAEESDYKSKLRTLQNTDVRLEEGTKGESEETRRGRCPLCLSKKTEPGRIGEHFEAQYNRYKGLCEKKDLELDRLRDEIEHLEVQYNKCKGFCEKKDLELNGLREEIKHLEAQYNRYKELCEKGDLELNQLREEITHLESRGEKFRTSNIHPPKREQDMKVAIQELKKTQQEALGVLNAKLASAETENRAFEEQLDISQAKQGEANVLRGEIESVKNENLLLKMQPVKADEKLQAEIQTMHAKVDSLNTELASARNESLEVDRQLATTKEQLQSVNQKLRENIEFSETKLAAAKKEKQDASWQLGKANQKLRVEIQRMDEEVDILRGKLTAAENENLVRREQLATANERLQAETHEEVHILRGKLAAAKNDNLMRSEQLVTANEKSQAEIQNRRKDISSLSTKLEAAQESLTRTQEALAKRALPPLTPPNKKRGHAMESIVYGYILRAKFAVHVKSYSEARECLGLALQEANSLGSKPLEALCLFYEAIVDICFHDNQRALETFLEVRGALEGASFVEAKSVDMWINLCKQKDVGAAGAEPEPLNSPPKTTGSWTASGWRWLGL